jgi:hypothetical protein
LDPIIITIRITKDIENLAIPIPDAKIIPTAPNTNRIKIILANSVDPCPNI